MLHYRLVPHLNQTYAHEYPEKFADASVETRKEPDSWRGKSKHANDGCKATLARAQLHGEEEQHITHERGEGEDYQRVAKTYRYAQRSEDEEELNELEKLQAENRVLKAKTKQQQMEIDFLKKLDAVERR